MSIVLVTYPPQVKKGGEEAAIVATFPKGAGESVTVKSLEKLQRQFRGKLEIAHLSDGSPKITRSVMVASVQDAREKALQFGKLLHSDFPYEPIIQPCAEHATA